jgi:hypothetical protein
MKAKLVLCLLTLMLLAGCNSVPTKDMSFDTQADPKASFSGYKTYSWLGSAAILNDMHGQWEPPNFDADAEVKYLIDRELRKRGMSENSYSPDLIVAFAAGIDMDVLELKLDPDGHIQSLTNVPRGGLAIGLVDAQTGFVIWMGVAGADVQKQPDTKTAKARLDYAVTRLFRELPR